MNIKSFRDFDFDLREARLVFEDEKKGGFGAWLSGLFGGSKKAEAPAPAVEAPAEAPGKCPNCGGDMTEGHVCPEMPVAAPAETPAPEAPAPAVEAPAPAVEAQAPADAPAEAPGKCPNCGGDMTEGHTCS